MPTLRAAKARQGVLAELLQVLSGDHHGADVRPLQPGHHHQQRRFARTRRAEQANGLAAPICRSMSSQDMDAGGAAAERQVDAAQRDGVACERMPGNVVHVADRSAALCTLIPTAHMGRGAHSSKSRRNARRRDAHAPWRWRLWRCRSAAQRRGAGQYRRARRFADRRLRPARQGWLRAAAASGACGKRYRGRRSTMPACPAIPRPTGLRGSTGRCRTVPMRSSSNSAPTTCCAGSIPRHTRAALDTILRRLTERHIAVLLCGMRAAPNLGADYAPAFDSIYPALAAKYGVLLYPFFLDGVAGDLALAQRDGMHPNAAGRRRDRRRILPQGRGTGSHAPSRRPSPRSNPNDSG